MACTPGTSSAVTRAASFSALRPDEAPELDRSALNRRIQGRVFAPFLRSELRHHFLADGGVIRPGLVSILDQSRQCLDKIGPAHDAEDLAFLVYDWNSFDVIFFKQARNLAKRR